VSSQPFPGSCFNSGDSSAIRSQVLSSQTPVQNSLGCLSCLPYNSSVRPSQTTAFILVCVSVASGTYLPSRYLVAVVCSCLLRICCLATHFVSFSVSRPLPRNDCCFTAVRYQRLFLWLHSSWCEHICHTCNVFFLDCLHGFSRLAFSVSEWFLKRDFSHCLGAVRFRLPLTFDAEISCEIWSSQFSDYKDLMSSWMWRHAFSSIRRFGGTCCTEPHLRR
jgi:hypothetical protein